MSRMVKRTLDLFELFGEARRPLGLSDISRAMSLPVSSCHDVLNALEERGYLYRLGSRGGYYPTAKLAGMTARIADNDPFLQRADIEMRALRARFDGSVFLARAQGATARYLKVVEGQGPWRFHIEEGREVRALHATSAGKAVLGSLDAPERAAVIASLDLVRLTPATLCDRSALAAEVEASLALGWFLNREESVPTATTLSCLLRWGGAVHVLTLAGPATGLAPVLDEAAAALVAVARRLESPR